MLCIFNTTTVFTQAQHKTIQLVSLLADEAQHDTPYEHRYQPHQGAPQPGNAQLKFWPPCADMLQILGCTSGVRCCECSSQTSIARYFQIGKTIRKEKSIQFTVCH